MPRMHPYRMLAAQSVDYGERMVKRSNTLKK